MKTLLTSLLFASSLFAATDDQIADAIWKVEGGSKAKAPYGILSVKVSSPAMARRICLKTIANNRARWLKAGQPGDYLDFLADRYCPPSVDPAGNRNWKRNVKAILK